MPGRFITKNGKTFFVKEGISKNVPSESQQKKHDEQFNRFQDYNEKNFGLVKLRLKYPNETDQQIFDRIQGKR